MKEDRTEVSAEELLRAKDAAAALLQSLGLEAYLFEVELHGDQWEVKLECAIKGGWQSVTLPARRTALTGSLDDAQQRKELIDAWSGRLACLR
jgi:hypothetical protein